MGFGTALKNLDSDLERQYQRQRRRKRLLALALLILLFILLWPWQCSEESPPAPPPGVAKTGNLRRKPAPKQPPREVDGGVKFLRKEFRYASGQSVPWGEELSRAMSSLGPKIQKCLGEDDNHVIQWNFEFNPGTFEFRHISFTDDAGNGLAPPQDQCLAALIPARFPLPHTYPRQWVRSTTSLVAP